MNLLKEGIELGYVIKTDRAKKLVIDGLSQTYPIYKVRLNHLFYNDQNDRIATWISEYESKEVDSLDADKFTEEYNAIIQKFITNSNPEKLKQTQLNISLFGQQESGVVLSDGRIIDGNRRFTCLRNLSKNRDEFNYFETVILDKNYEHDEKQIKMLELQIQIGKEERVDYDPVDRLVGIYRDIVAKKILTVEEYSRSINKKEADVRKELEIAQLMNEFLETINAKGKYYLARELKLDGPLRELQQILRRIKNEDKKEEIKNIAFVNMLASPSKDITRFIRKLGTISTSKYVDDFTARELEISEIIVDSLPNEKEMNSDAIAEIRADEEIKDILSRTMEKFENKAKVSQTKNKPSQLLKKAIDNVSTIDMEIIKHLSLEHKEDLKETLIELEEEVNKLKEVLNIDD